MTYSIKQHCGLRLDMRGIYNGTNGKFNSLADAIAWAHFKHDNLNNTFICLANDDIIYGIGQDGKSFFTEAYKKHVLENPWLEWDVKQYRLQMIK